MRILMLNHNIAFGGATFDRVHHLSEQLVKHGHEPTLMTIARKDRLRFRIHQSEGVKVIETPDLFWGIGRTGWDPWDTFRRVLHSQRRTYDAVYAFDSRPAVIVPALAYVRRHGVPLIMDWADWWGRGGTIGERSFKRISGLIGPFEGWLEEAFRRNATRTTVISRALEERAADLGVDRSTILRIPNGSNVDSIRPYDLTTSRARLGLPEDQLIIGHIGHLYQGDGQLFRTAVDHAVSRCPNLRVAMLGRPGDQFDAAWEQHPATLVPGFVPREDLGHWLTACDALVLPLRDTVHNRGRWPGKVNDYLAAGRPVVSTAVGDIREILDCHPVGVMSEPNGEALGEAILEVLADPGRRCSMGMAARHLAENDLSWQRMGAKLQDMLEGLT